MPQTHQTENVTTKTSLPPLLRDKPGTDINSPRHVRTFTTWKTFGSSLRQALYHLKKGKKHCEVYYHRISPVSSTTGSTHTNHFHHQSQPVHKIKKACNISRPSQHRPDSNNCNHISYRTHFGQKLPSASRINAPLVET